MRPLSLHLFFSSTCSIFSTTMHSVNEFLDCVFSLLSIVSGQRHFRLHSTPHSSQCCYFGCLNPELMPKIVHPTALQWINWEGQTKFHWTKVASSSLAVKELGQYHMHSSRQFCQRGDITCAEKHVIVDEDVSSSFGSGKRGALPVTKKVSHKISGQKKVVLVAFRQPATI